MQQGKIIKQISNDYTVRVNDRLYIFKARGKFRNLGITPLVGDNALIDEENNYILEIQKRKNELFRPSISNVDQAIIVMSNKIPEFSLELLDKLLCIIEYNNIIANLYNTIGIYFYNKIKDYKHSIELFSKAIEFNKNQKEYFKNRSKAYEIIGDNINASKDMLSFKQL